MVLVGCKKKQKEVSLDDLFKYEAYIAEVPRGLISTSDDLIIVFQEPTDAITDLQKLPKDWYSITPDIAGSFAVTSAQSIIFQPDTPFIQDTEYVVTLQLSKLYPNIDKSLQEFKFGFTTIKQQMQFYTQNLQTYNKNLYHFNGEIHTADIASFTQIQKTISATYQNKDFPIRFLSSQSKSNSFSIKFDSIPRQTNDADLIIQWNGEAIGTQEKGEEKIRIPGKSNFTILEVEVIKGKRPYVEVVFSDPIKKNQNFKGLVQISDANPGVLQFEVSDNLLKVYPSKVIHGGAILEIFEGIESAAGYRLKKSMDYPIAFQQLKPGVRFLNNGSILPSSSNLKINFEAVSLDAVDVEVLRIYENNILQFLQTQNLNGKNNLKRVARPIAKKTISLQSKIGKNLDNWTAFAIDLQKLIAPQAGAIYRIELSYKPHYSTYACDNTNFEAQSQTQEDYDNNTENSFWDGAEGYYDNQYSYNYNWNERDNPCHTSYYYNKKIGQNVLASNIGATVKRGNNQSYFIAVNDLLTTAPIAGAKIVLYNFQQQEIGQQQTDSKGYSYIDSKSKAYFAVISYNGQKTYLKLNDGNALSVSKFDVSGVRLQKGLKGFIYGERGVWRPGDNIYLSFMLNDKSNPLPDMHPVSMELVDPYGKVTERLTQKQGVDKIYSFLLATDSDAPTGNWTARVKVGGVSFSKTIKIETIKPNRLKILASFEEDMLLSNSNMLGSLEVKWLHGAIAKNLQADITAKFFSTSTNFKSYPNFRFHDPARNFYPSEENVFNGKLNQMGKANFRLSPDFEEYAPGMLEAKFLTKVYEEGGDFSTDVFSKTYSPFQTYVGLLKPKGDKTRGMLLTDTKHRFEIQTVDPYGKPKSAKNLKVRIYKIAWKWWWNTSADNLSSYSQSSYRQAVFETTVSTNSRGQAHFDYELKYPEWGRYLVRVEDEIGGHATGEIVYIDWPGWAGKSRKNDPSVASMLMIQSDKKSYEVGETATISFPGGGKGRALVTVENGSEVLDALWVDLQKEATKVELAIKETYAPNVFIHISALQAHGQTENDLPIRRYGVIPLEVVNSQTKLQPTLKMPSELKPEQKVQIEVGEQNGNAMTYTIAMVDEGLLDLTRFKTPNPWDSFFAREALGVKTWDMYDDVIGAYGGRINQVFAIGGGDAEANAKKQKANRFKPVVIYRGPFRLKAGEKRSHQLQLPMYVGSVRTMIVAADSETEAYGSTEKATPVRNPLMLLTSLARKASPGEKAVIPVTVFAMQSKIKNVNVQLKAGEGFKILGEATKKIRFDKPGEKIVQFEVEFTKALPKSKIEVVAKGHGESAKHQLEIAIENPNPITAKMTELIVDPNSSKSFDFETFGTSGSNSAEIEISSLPPMNFNGRLKNLIRYPHGCVEQTTSAAFPQLYMPDLFALSNDQSFRIESHIKSAIKRLAGFQRQHGGLSYWSGTATVSDWGTTYAGHFMLLAERNGYVLPVQFKQRWISYQKQQANNWRDSRRASHLAQAYRLYTLALAGQSNLGAMNRLKEIADLSDPAKYRLAAAYALVGQHQAAKQLLENARNGQERNHQYTYGDTARNLAMQLETAIITKDKSKWRSLSQKVAKNLNGSTYLSTQSTAYSLIAMGAFAKENGGKSVSAQLTVNGKKEQLKSNKSLLSKDLKIKKGNNSLELKNQNKHILFVVVNYYGRLPIGQEVAQKRNLRLDQEFKDLKGNRISITKLAQGTNFVAEVSLSNLSSTTVSNIALSQLFPGGWEIVNTRFANFDNYAANQVTHTDIRDDRVHAYMDLKPYEVKTFRVLLNASYLGKYYLPAAQAAAMYDNEYASRNIGQWIEVIKE